MAMAPLREPVKRESAMMSGAEPPGDLHAGSLFDNLRALRSEVQDLESVLDKVRKGQVKIQTFAEYIQTTKADIEALLAKMQDGDTISHLHNLWEQMNACPLIKEPDKPYDSQEQLNYLDMLDEQIEGIIFLVGTITIPSRVNDWLKNARPGYYIPFHLVFEDEVPSQKDRTRILNYLTYSPEIIQGGIIDPANGLIYRYNKDARRRLINLLWLVLGFLAATGLVAGSALLPVPGWPLQPKDLGMLLIGWGAILVGVVTHIGIGTVKRSQSRGGLPPVFALGDLPLIVDAQLGQILVKLCLALIGLFSLVFAAQIQNVTLLNTFLVGYSLDSFIGLFGTSLEQQASAQVAVLKDQLGVQ
ncbi:MAG: hypothetical protein ACM3PY_06130 [Omnitrophica WOR_2 bacterium]